jgi:hypothetical protein
MELSLNWVRLEPLNNSFTIYRKATGKGRAYRAPRQDFTDVSGLELGAENSLYWDFTGSRHEAINLGYSNNPEITKHHIARLLERHLSKLKSILCGRGFIGEVVAYVPDDERNTDTYSVYDEYRLRAVQDVEESIYYLVVSYTGKMIVVSTSLAQLTGVPRDAIKRVRYKNRVLSYRHLSSEEKADESNLFVVAGRPLAQYTEIDPHLILFRKDRNPYQAYYLTVLEFYKRYLSGKVLDDSLRICDTGFKRVPPARIMETSKWSNLLVFGDEQTSFNVYTGIKQYGPLSVPDVNRLRYLFVFHRDDRQLANTLYTYLNAGLKGFPGLEAFVGLPFNMNVVDHANTIRYESDAPSVEIRRDLQTRNLSRDYRYFAIYISRIGRDERDGKRHSEYFKIKEILLERDMGSQVIHAKSIESPAFNFYLPNIAIAMLAKLGGKPWKLARPTQEDLIVGIGAHKHLGQSYIGNAICFANDGSFEEFDAFHRTGAEAMGAAFHEAISRFVKSSRKAKRLIIHFFKPMSEREERYLLKVLDALNLSLPYVVLTIHSAASNEIVIFDEHFEGRMPVTGTVVGIRPGDYLLCNNSRYEHNTVTRIDRYPLPLRVVFSKGRGVDIARPDVIRGLLDQVYQFSRMYWRTIRQKADPVTVEYSRLIAKSIAHFENKELPATFAARKSLWFL